MIKYIIQQIKQKEIELSILTVISLMLNGGGVYMYNSGTVSKLMSVMMIVLGSLIMLYVLIDLVIYSKDKSTD